MGRKLIRIVDNGCGMNRDDAMLAFERHATSKLRSSDDLLTIATLGFSRGEALAFDCQRGSGDAGDACAGGCEAGTVKSRSPVRQYAAMWRMPDCLQGTDDCGARSYSSSLPPARRKFLRAEQTELGHVAALVTHYALAHPQKHFELHSATQALLVAPAVADASERLFQIFGRDTFQSLVPVAAELDFARAGIPEPPPWKRAEDYEPPAPGFLRVSGFVSKPELQKLNRNSIYVFCEWEADSRPADSARVHGGVPEYYSADVVPGGAAVFGDATAGDRCECASGEDRGAVSARKLCA